MKNVSLSSSPDLPYNVIKDFCDNQLEKIKAINGMLDSGKNKILLEILNDKQFLHKLINYLTPVNVDMKSNDLDNIFKCIRKEVEELASEAQDAVDTDEKYNLSSKADALFLIIEFLTAEGKFPQDLISEISQKYGDSFIEIIEKLDRAILSEDVKLFKREQACDFDFNDELLKKYIVMKKWQDIQHTYLNNFFLNFAEKNEMDYFKKHGGEGSCFRYTNKAPRLREYIRLSQQKLLSLDSIANLLLASMEEEAIELCGGKAVGLAKLYMAGVKIPKTVVVNTNQNGDLENLSLPFSSERYAVRSSANVEDGTKHSFAGMFSSCLDVKKEDLQGAIKKVKNSVNNERVKVYVETNKTKIPNMAVVIQEFKMPEYSGVWIGEGITSGHLEYVKGSGDKLVSGKTNPEHEYWDNNSRNEIKSLKLKNGKSIGEELLNLQEKMNVVGDFEWCVLDGKLTMLQYRAVTSSVNFSIENSKKIVNSQNIIKGVAASRGTATGKITYIRDIHEYDSDIWNKDNILAAWFTDPDWMKVLVKCKGLVTAMGGFLCHGAIIARELGIPCVVGIGPNGMKKLWKEKNVAIDKEITVDGSKGEVHIVE